MNTKAKVYRNLNKNCWSVKIGKNPVEHYNYVILKDVKFRVQPSGQRRAISQKRRNIHAYAKGTFLKEFSETCCQFSPIVGESMKIFGNQLYKVRYNPFIRSRFFFERVPSFDIYQSSYAVFDTNGTCWATTTRPDYFKIRIDKLYKDMFTKIVNSKILFNI